jgi:hypothetical protein
MNMTIEHEILLQHSIGELRRMAKLFKVKMGDRSILDIINDIIAARNKVNQQRRATARQKAIVTGLHG